MGVLTTIGDLRLEPKSFSLTEDSGPLVGSDTTGSVGHFSLVFQLSDVGNVTDVLLWKGEGVQVEDSEHGITFGTVESVDININARTVSLTCPTRLSILNAYNVQTQPYTGTLTGLITYYFSLAGVTTGFTIDPALDEIPVCVIGWKGELWMQLKKLLSVHNVDISLADGEISVRPIRAYALGTHTTKANNVTMPVAQLARSVEVYRYETEQITNKLVYPDGGWSPEVDPITISAGQVIEQTLELGASVSSVQQPQFRTIVTPGHATSSVFTVIGDDGLPLTKAAWDGAGGYLKVTINPDTTSLTLRVKAPTGLPSSKGEELKTFTLALASGASGNRYSTLRIIGTGVRYKKTKKTFRTGVPESRTATEVGLTIDNLFLTTLDAVYTSGARAAAQAGGRMPSIGGSAASSHITNDFGKVAGARFWDRVSRRFYRVRNATLGKGDISLSADDDLLVDDIQERFAGLTCADVEAIYNGLSCEKAMLKGIPT